MTLENYTIRESKLLNRFCVERNLAPSTKIKYEVALKRYTEYFNMTIEELVDEADKEEELIPRESKRKIRDRLIDFRVHLKQKEYTTNTIINTVSSVKTFYRHFGISIPHLPPMNYDKSPNDDIEFQDLPTIENVKQAIENANKPKHKALFLFITCSGTARNETANFTFGDFIEGLNEYYPNLKTPEDVILELDGKCEEKEVIPCFRMEREKTGYSYHTIITPECTQFMINYLKHEGLSLKPNDKFFKLTPKGITSAFKSINNKMRWGDKGTIDFFSPHRLRKFNASVIEDTELANYIQGRKPTKIKETYFKKNKERIREEYTKHLHKFSIYSRYNVMINSEAYLEMKEALEKEKKQHAEDNKRYEAELERLKSSNQSVTNQVNDMQNQIDNITHANDLTRIQEYISNNEIVSQYNLSSIIIGYYKEDVKREDFSGVTDSYIEELISTAYNSNIASKRTTDADEISDDALKEIESTIEDYKSDCITSNKFRLSESQKKKIKTELHSYAIELWKTKEKADKSKVEEIILSIITR